MAPHLVTALTGPINELEQRILDSTPAIERWFRLEWMEHTPPFYCAVDVRNAGFKLAPVDTNLFPDGWNVLTPAMLPCSMSSATSTVLSRISAAATRPPALARSRRCEMTARRPAARSASKAGRASGA